MANAKYQEIYRLLDNYDFHIDIQLYPDLTCIICKRILNKAHQSPCGCRYCYSCIKHYLKGNMKFCPGSSDDCQEQAIDIDKDLQFDHVANRKISLIEVKCPEKFCLFTDELKNIVEHIDSHQMKCPFHDMGCNHLRINTNTLKDHLNDENYSHTILLMDSMQNMKNEIEFLKEISQKRETIIDELKEELLTVKEENSEKIEAMKTEISELKNILKINKIYMKNKRSKESNMFREGRPINLEQEESTINLPEESFDITNLEINSSVIGIRRNRHLSSSSSIRSDSVSQDYAPFEWKIDDFVKRRNEAKSKMSKNIYSKPFYSHMNGYKLRLRVNPNGFGVGENSHLSVFFSLIEGEYDDWLLWPMEQQVTIALMDQTTGKTHVCDKYKFNSIDKDFREIFHKPSTRKENGDYYYYGTPILININVMMNNAKLFRNGAILLKCFINN